MPFSRPLAFARFPGAGLVALTPFWLSACGSGSGSSAVATGGDAIGSSLDAGGQVTDVDGGSVGGEAPASGNDAGVAPDAADAATTPNAMSLQYGGLFVMTLSGPTSSYDVLIDLAGLDTPSQLLAFHQGDVLVAPPAPEDLLYADQTTIAAACAYAFSLNGGTSPCFDSQASEVVPVSTSVMGQTLTGAMSWNRTGFVRQLVEEPQMLTVQSPDFGPLDVVVVKTQHLNVGDALPDTNGDVVITSTDVAPHDLPGGDDTSPQWGTTFGVSTVDLSGKTLFDQDGVTVTLGSTTITNHPSVHTELGMKSGAIQHLQLLIEDDLNVQVMASTSVSASYEKDIAQEVFSSDTILPLQLVGLIPVAETVHFALTAHCHLAVSSTAETSFGVALQQHIVLGTEYLGGQWSNLSDAGAPVLSPVGPTVQVDGTASLECDLVPKYSLLLYDIVGPFVSVTPSATLSVNTDPTGGGLAWSVDGEFSGALGIAENVSLPGVSRLVTAFDLNSVNLSLFDVKQSLASGTLP